jgi:hypothetical protein
MKPLQGLNASDLCADAPFMVAKLAGKRFGSFSKS